MESKIKFKDVTVKSKEMQDDGTEITKKKSVKVPEKTVDNIIAFLNEDPKYKGKFKLNMYSKTMEYDGEPMNDMIKSVIVNDVERGIGLFSDQKTEHALDEIFNNPINQYHPVKDYLRNLVWDGTKRVERMFVDWFKAEDTSLNREYAKKWMIAAVKRMIEPGCKFDNVVLLQGAQGIGKSTFCERLSAGFGCGDNIDIDEPKEYIQILNKSWICVMDELKGFTKKEQNNIKNFLSKTEDTARLSYERYSVTYKRHVVFIGSTNNEKFLNDYTQMTERRYWIVKCNTVDRFHIYDNFNSDVVDQLWAEAYYLYKKNPNICLDIEKDLYEDFSREQIQYKSIMDDDAYIYLENILERKYPTDEFMDDQFRNFIDSESQYKNVVYINRIPVRYINIALDRVHLNRSGQWKKLAMEELGWEKKVAGYKSNGKTTEMCWCRKNTAEIDIKNEIFG